jgi:hypothetical protein
MINKRVWALPLLVSCFLLLTSAPVFSIDSDLTRRTISGLPGVNVTVEEIQPNIQKYAQKVGLTSEQIQRAIESRLKAAGIRIYSWNDWLKTPGKPSLYVNVNTHEYEKYWYAYDVSLELKQMVSLEINPSTKTLAATWSQNMTGIANIGTLDSIRNDVMRLTDRFIDAYKSVNQKK